MEVTLEKFKLAVLSHDEFTGDQVEQMFYEVNINDVHDIVAVVCILQRNRPKLFKKLETAIKNRK